MDAIVHACMIRRHSLQKKTMVATRNPVYIGGLGLGDRSIDADKTEGNVRAPRRVGDVCPDNDRYHSAQKKYRLNLYG